MKRIVFIILISVLVKNAGAQSFSFTCPKDTTIDCSQSCITLQTTIPDIHAFTDDYNVNLLSGPGGCFRPPISPATPGTSTNLNQDDRYTPVIPFPSNFTFYFYGGGYVQCVVNTNGIVSFDLTNASTGAQWIIQGLDGSLPSTDYDKAIIMGAFHDIDISRPESPTRQIKVDVVGTAPCRKWVLSFYKVPCFDCNNLIENTYQIVLYEAVSIVEVYVFGRQVCTTWNAGAAMIGMQNYDQDRGIMAPGRSAFTTPRWQGPNMNEAWRFTPKQGPSLFKSVELTDLSGNTVVNGIVSPGANNDFNVTFPNVCPPATTTYLVKTAYYNQEYPFQYPQADSIIYSLDTFTVYKNGSIPALNVTKTDAVCGPNPNGTITVTAPTGANYEYSIDGGTTYQPSNVFSVPPGTYTVTVHDVTGTCTKDTTVTVGSPATFTATATSTNTSCPTASNGTITVTPSAAGTYTYDIDNSGTFVSSNVFNGVAAGDHNIAVKDAAGCAFGFTYTVLSDAGFTTTASSLNATCRGIANGSLTVVVPSSGQAPFTYTIGTNNQLSNPVFSGLLGDSTYEVIITDNIGCADTISQAVNSDPGVSAVVNTLSASCIGVNNGSITITPSGGTGPYFYDTTGTGTYVALAALTNLASGTYNVTIKDNTGCLYTPPAITVSAGTGVRANYDVVNATCTAAANGRIIIRTTNGSAPFTYSLNSAGFVALDTIRNLAPGPYSVRVKDNVGCYLDLPPITIGANDPGISATTTLKPTECFNATTGQVFIAPTSGTGPFSYSLDNGAFTLLTDTIRNLDSGFHRIVLKDALGCNITLNPEVLIGPGVNAIDSVIVSACTEAATGKIFVKPTLGIAPFQFSKDSGITWQNNIDSFLNLSPGSYNIAVKDAVGCVYHFRSTVGAGPGITATDSTVVSNCATATTGKIFIRPLSGIAPYRFSRDSGLTWQNNIDSFVSLAPGTYNIAVRDAVGCTYRFRSTVGVGLGVTATDSTVVSNCATATTGKIFIRALTGVGPFRFSRDSGVTWQNNIDSFISLAPGIYNIAVRDAVGCTYYFRSTVGVGPGVTATDSTVMANCSVAANGKLYINNPVGVVPFSFSIDSGTTYQNSNAFVNLLPNTYHIAVRDAVGCIYRFNSAVGAGTGITATDSTIVSNCSTATTGKIFIKTGGLTVAPIQFSNDSGLTWQNNVDSFVNLLPGSYRIAVKDALGCTYRFTSTVGAGPGVTATDSVIKSECATAITGKIFIRSVSGVAPFQYSKDSGLTWQAVDSFVKLAPGLYHIAVKDAVGCVYRFNSTVGTGNGVNATAASVNAACLGVSTGKIIVTPTSGTAPFTYTVNGSPSFALDTLRSLASGPYNIVLSDAVGCSYNLPAVTVNNDIGVTASFTKVQTACATAATGAIIVKTLTGTPGFSYSIDGGATFQADSVFRKLAANNYNIQIRDAVGCIFNSPVQAVTSKPGVLTDPSTIQNASCASIPNGSITVNVTAGVAPFTYVITSPVSGTPQSSNLFTALFSGNYSVLITDSAGCTKTITPVVGNNPKVKIDSVNVIRPTCNGLQNGTVTINVSLGVAPYQYAIDAGSWSNSKTISSIGAGPHTLHIKDANNCSIDSVITVTEPAVLSNAVLSISKATCTGNPDGRIIVKATGGTTPYTYTLDQSGLVGYQSSDTFNVLKGNYRVSVKDAKGCVASVNAVVDSVFTMYLDLGAEQTICSGSSIVLSPNTNPETTIFTYSPKASLDNDNIKNPTAAPLDTTTYTLTAQWGICKLTDNIKVNVLRKPVADAGSDVVICYDSIAVLKASAYNLSGTVNYLWSPAVYLETKADSNVVTVRPKLPDTYFKVTVTDNYNCNFSVTDSVLVKMLPKVYAFAGNDTNAVLNLPHQLTATGAGAGGSYIWTAPAGVTLSDNYSATPTAIFVPVPEPGTYVPDTNYYVLSVKATDLAGCWATDDIKINVFIGPTCYVPTAFSPNGDGLNDIFKPVPVGLNIDYFRVFNRYGEVVYETSRFMKGWDGVYKGKPQPNGAYVWIFKGKDRKGRDIVNKGTVMLVR